MHPGLAQPWSSLSLPAKASPAGQQMIIRFDENDDDDDDDPETPVRGPVSSTGRASTGSVMSGGAAGVSARNPSRQTSRAAAPSPKKLRGAKGRSQSAPGPAVKAAPTSRGTQVHDAARAKAAASAQATSAAASAGLLQQIAKMRQQIESMQTASRSTPAAVLAAGVGPRGPGQSQRPVKRAKVVQNGAVELEEGVGASNQAVSDGRYPVSAAPSLVLFCFVHADALLQTERDGWEVHRHGKTVHVPAAANPPFHRSVLALRALFFFDYPGSAYSPCNAMYRARGREEKHP